MDRRAILIIGTLLLVFALLERNPSDDSGDKGDNGKRPAEPAPFVLACESGGHSSVRIRRATRHDAVLGPVTIYGFRGEFERAKESEVYARGPAGVRVLKAPVVFAVDRDVTIAVPKAYRPVLGLDYDASRRGVDTVAEGEPAVRFRPCGGERGATGHAGGLLYGGPWPACVPLQVSVDGGPAATHRLSLGAGPCRAPK
jgi:hypothetical protein